MIIQIVGHGTDNSDPKNGWRNGLVHHYAQDVVKSDDYWCKYTDSQGSEHWHWREKDSNFLMRREIANRIQKHESIECWAIDNAARGIYINVTQSELVYLVLKFSQ